LYKRILERDNITLEEQHEGEELVEQHHKREVPGDPEDQVVMRLDLQLDLQLGLQLDLQLDLRLDLQLDHQTYTLFMIADVKLTMLVM